MSAAPSGVQTNRTSRAQVLLLTTDTHTPERPAEPPHPNGPAARRAPSDLHDISRTPELQGPAEGLRLAGLPRSLYEPGRPEARCVIPYVPGNPPQIPVQAQSSASATRDPLASPFMCEFSAAGRHAHAPLDSRLPTLNLLSSELVAPQSRDLLYSAAGSQAHLAIARALRRPPDSFTLELELELGLASLSFARRRSPSLSLFSSCILDPSMASAAP